MARVVGVRVTHVEFYPGKDPQATCYQAEEARAVIDRAAIMYAGFAAERHLNPERAAHYATDDLLRFYRLQVDHERVIARTEAAVAAHWDEIERLAGEIERCNGLYTEELRALGYWWPAPARDPTPLARFLRGPKAL